MTSQRKLETIRHHLMLCNGESCMRQGGEAVTQAVRAEIAALGLNDTIHTTRTRCNGRCVDACVVITYPSGDWYKEMTPASSRLLVHALAQDTKLHQQLVHSMEAAQAQDAAQTSPTR